MNIRERLFELKDDEYAEFHAKLVPTIARETIIGIRVPNLRSFAKEIRNEPETADFLKELPHKYYDENMLHSLIISEWKNYNEVVDKIQEFLPYVDNWAVCDSLKPKVFKKNKDKVIELIGQWISSKETYTCRFGIEMLMTYFLDEDFREEYLELPAKVKSNEYYVNMMIAWYYATALAKQWDSTIPYIENYRLGEWVHNKTIQKARESYRISPEQKEYLRLRRKK